MVGSVTRPSDDPRSSPNRQKFGRRDRSAYFVARCRTCGHVLEGALMSAGIPRIYTSFAEFEREELRRLDSLHTSVDDLVEERFAEELDLGGSDRPRKRGRPRKNP